MNSSKNKIIKKCKGCGKGLSLNKDDIAYTPNLEFEYCQRCFQLKHYGINTKSNIAKDQTNEILKNISISEKNWVVLVNDILNIDLDLIKKFSHYKKKIYIFNKCDLIVNNKNRVSIFNNIEKLLENYDSNEFYLFLTSSVNNSGIRKLCEFIGQSNWNEKFYFVGQTNSGKSSLLNKLIKESKSRSKPLTISNFLNTTIGLKKINILKHDVIDTPGYNSEKNVLLKLKNDKDIRNFLSKHQIKSKTFQLTGSQTLLFDNLGCISCESSDKYSITVYMSENVEVKRIKTENLEKNLQNNEINKFELRNQKFCKHEFDLSKNEKYNVVICGLGLLLIKRCEKVTISAIDGVDVNLLNGVII